MLNKPVTVDLVLPGLLNLPAYEIEGENLPASTPNLHRFLRYARQQKNSAYDIDSILISLLNLEQAGLPYARALSGRTDQFQLLFKPVYLKSDINNAIVFPVENKDDIPLLINDLGSYFKVDFNIEALPGNYWLMTLHDVKPFAGMPHHLTALGKKVTHYLEQARENLEWFKLFNEMQMFLYQHEVNQRRLQNGLPLINSIWPWGSDDYHGETLHGVHWYSDDPLMQSLGELYQAEVHSLDDFSKQPLGARNILIDLSILEALKGDMSCDLSSLLLQLDHRYFAAMRANKGVNWMVYAAAPDNFHFNTTHTLKFWKRPLAITDLLI